jgi:uncharacterized membrane protein YcjF (UPF0283 family)
MIRRLITRAIGPITIRAVYYLWIRVSGAMLVLSAMSLSAADSWLAQTGLTLVLCMLLIGGILILVFGVRDLFRDWRRLVRLRAEKKSHA